MVTTSDLGAGYAAYQGAAGAESAVDILRIWFRVVRLIRSGLRLLRSVLAPWKATLMVVSGERGLGAVCSSTLVRFC
jgi:hypothetical protein